jgi:SAM-dependent methyltransferase
MDAVLLLGALYYPRALPERQKAVREAWRILKPDGIVAAPGISRITFLRDMFRSPDPFSAAFFGPAFADALSEAQTDPDGNGFIAQFLETGTLDPPPAPPISYAHLTTIAEFRQLLMARFEELVLTGTESFTSPRQDEWKIEIRRRHRKVVGSHFSDDSDHFLFIGRR